MQERVKKAKKRAAKGRGKGRATKPVKFDVNAVYRLNEAAEIIRRHPDTIKKAARLGRIRHRFDSAGYLFTGWALRDYSEGRCLVDVTETQASN